MQHINNTYPKPTSPCTCLNIRRASRAVTQFYDEVLKPSGIRIAQLGLLRLLEKEATITELAKAMRIDRTTLNRNMKPLVEAGFITVNPGKDSRTRLVGLTATGKEAVAQAWRLWGEAQTAIAEYLGNEDLAKFAELMAKLEALVP